MGLQQLITQGTEFLDYFKEQWATLIQTSNTPGITACQDAIMREEKQNYTTLTKRK